MDQRSSPSFFSAESATNIEGRRNWPSSRREKGTKGLAYPGSDHVASGGTDMFGYCITVRRQRLVRKQPQGEQQHVAAVEWTTDATKFIGGRPPFLSGPLILGSRLWLTMFASLPLCLIFAKSYQPRPHEARVEPPLWQLLVLRIVAGNDRA